MNKEEKKFTVLALQETTAYLRQARDRLDTGYVDDYDRFCSLIDAVIDLLIYEECKLNEESETKEENDN